MTHSQHTNFFLKSCDLWHLYVHQGHHGLSSMGRGRVRWEKPPDRVKNSGAKVREAGRQVERATIFNCTCRVWEGVEEGWEGGMGWDPVIYPVWSLPKHRYLSMSGLAKHATLEVRPHKGWRCHLDFLSARLGGLLVRKQGPGAACATFCKLTECKSPHWDRGI